MTESILYATISTHLQKCHHESAFTLKTFVSISSTSGVSVNFEKPCCLLNREETKDACFEILEINKELFLDMFSHIFYYPNAFNMKWFITRAVLEC